VKVRAFLMCVVLAGCSNPDASSDKSSIAALRTAAHIPPCAVIDPSLKSTTNHLRVVGGFRDTMHFTGNRACMDGWNRSLGVKASDTGPIYFDGDDSAYLMVARVVKEIAPEGDRMFVQWLHKEPIEGVTYDDGRKTND
jgi:hypothetical protein